MREETPGVVTAVGPDWLVSFREGGADVPFVVDSQGEYDVYSVATGYRARLPHDQKSAPESLLLPWQIDGNQLCDLGHATQPYCFIEV